MIKSKKERGAALIIGLIFLVMMSVVGISAMQNVNIQERVSGNYVDGNASMQVAEFVLATAERRIIEDDAFFLNNRQRIVDISDGDTALKDWLKVASWQGCKAIGDNSSNPQKCTTIGQGLAKYERLTDENSLEGEIYRVTVRYESVRKTIVVLQSTYRRLSS